jgi:hypothetical protein
VLHDVAGSWKLIARAWKAMTTLEKLPAYVEAVRKAVLPQLSEKSGYKGSQFMQGPVGNQVEILVLTYWDSMPNAGALSGPSREGAWMPPEIEATLEQFDHDVTLYDVMINDRTGQ